MHELEAALSKLSGKQQMQPVASTSSLKPMSFHGSGPTTSLRVVPKRDPRLYVNAEDRQIEVKSDNTLTSPLDNLRRDVQDVFNDSKSPQEDAIAVAREPTRWQESILQVILGDSSISFMRRCCSVSRATPDTALATKIENDQ